MIHSLDYLRIYLYLLQTKKYPLFLVGKKNPAGMPGKSGDRESPEGIKL
jgi:hypothetical protein